MIRCQAEKTKLARAPGNPLYFACVMGSLMTTVS
uniref:Uncharacterized protein n=1 Tax=Anguilla anguilla TaxID=7936 RepID=A0A0E9PR37_ANGAN